jgi:ABC-2 type transport system ATP-binding protein
LDIIEVKGLSIEYAGGRKSVRDCTFQVGEGEVFGLLGSNGAGKSTILQTFAGLNKDYEGEIRIFGKDCRDAGRDIFRRIAYIPQHACMFRDFSVRDNLEFFARMEGIGGEAKEKRIAELMEFFMLGRFESASAGSLSGGYRQLLNIALSSLHDKKIVLMDEPTAGLDLWAKRKVVEYIRLLRKGGRTVILTTHDLEEAEDICDDAVILAEGKIMGKGNIRELLLEMGGGYTIYVYLKEPERLKHLKLKFSAQFAVFNDHIVVEANTKNIGPAIRELMSKLERAGIEISEIDVREPSLSYVFSSLVSRGEKA